MTINFELAWWWIPTVITVIALLWALWGDDLASIVLLIPALAVISSAWIIAGFLK